MARWPMPVEPSLMMTGRVNPDNLALLNRRLTARTILTVQLKILQFFKYFFSRSISFAEIFLSFKRFSV